MKKALILDDNLCNTVLEATGARNFFGVRETAVQTACSLMKRILNRKPNTKGFVGQVPSSEIGLRLTIHQLIKKYMASLLDLAIQDLDEKIRTSVLTQLNSAKFYPFLVDSDNIQCLFTAYSNEDFKNKELGSHNDDLHTLTSASDCDINSAGSVEPSFPSSFLLQNTSTNTSSVQVLF